MSIFYSNEGSLSSTGVNVDADDRDDDDDFDDAADLPLSRPKADFVPTRDPLVAALFGPAVSV